MSNTAGDSRADDVRWERVTLGPPFISGEGVQLTHPGKPCVYDQPVTGTEGVTRCACGILNLGVVPEP